MKSKEKRISTDIYRNPFEEVNANVLETKEIVDLWCSPFTAGLLSDYDERRFGTSRLPIILQGIRGSGKTTILRYFSFPAQIERADASKGKDLMSIVKEEGSVGFYYRCERAFINNFVDILKHTKKERWVFYFETYIEFVFSKKIIDMIIELSMRGMIIDNLDDIIISKTRDSSYLGKSFKSFDDLHSFINENLTIFNNFKNRAIYLNDDLNISILVDFFSISELLITIVKQEIVDFNKTIFLFMIDEFENLPFELQRMFNTIVKFVKKDISLRIGRRSEGLVTTETVNETEYLRENHDYYLATIGDNLEKLNHKGYRDFFLDIASKRIGDVDSKSGEQIILYMLGDHEDLDQECLSICHGRTRHIEEILKCKKQISDNEELLKKIVLIIQNTGNPILETLNALWIIRSKKEPLKAAEYVRDVMNAFLEKNNNFEGVRKYKSDYSNKYRYAITSFICNIYKVEKQYYGFNTVSYLSNGNARNFINICGAIIREAMFFDRVNYLNTGRISPSIQSKAIHSFSRSEFDNICSIISYGDSIKRFVLNIGNVLLEYYKDKRIRYPETTQFTYDEAKINPEEKRVLNVAENWAIILKREKPQRVSVSNPTRVNLCRMNKVFCPLFNISYRTRGGYNLELSSEDISCMLNVEHVNPKNIAFKNNKKQEKESIDYNQVSIFDLGDYDE